MTRSNRFAEIKIKRSICLPRTCIIPKYDIWLLLISLHFILLRYLLLCILGDWYEELSYREHPAMSQNHFICIFSNTRIKITRISLTRLYNLLPGTVSESAFVAVWMELSSSCHGNNLYYTELFWLRQRMSKAKTKRSTKQKLNTESCSPERQPLIDSEKHLILCGEFSCFVGLVLSLKKRKKNACAPTR